MHPSLLFATLIPAVVADLPFEKVFAARKALSDAKPIPSPTVNRQQVASSIISVLSARHNTQTAVPTSKIAITTRSNSKSIGRTTRKNNNNVKTTKVKPTKAKKPKTKRTKAKLTSVKQLKVKKTTIKLNKKVKAKSKKVKARSKRKHKRDGTCAAQSLSFNYVSTPNTPQGFLTDLILTSTSTSAKPPAGYGQNFTAQYGSLFASNYIGYYQLSSYSVSACAASCDSIPSCQAFNIYFERDPTLDPAATCPNPTAGVSVRCALWGSNVNAAQANNLGEYRQNFLLLIQGSNGYNKNTVPSSVTGYASPAALAAAVDPSSIPSSSPAQYLGYTFNAAGYDPNVCARFCASTTAANRAAAIAAGSNNYNACNWVNSFLITYNSTSQGMYCQAFTGDASQFASLYTQTINGVNYGITYSYGYALNAVDSGVISATTSSSTSASQSAASTNGASATSQSSAASVASSSSATFVASSPSAASVASSSSSTPVATSSSSTPVTTSSRSISYASYTSTSINSGTGTAVITSTITPASSNGVATVQLIYPTPVQTCGNGGSNAVAWAAYQNLVTNVAGLSTFDPTLYKTRTPLYSGSSNYIGIYADALASTLNNATIYGSTGRSGTALVVNHKFYIYANQPGTYTITVPYADDIAFAWIGTKAISGWNRSNADVNQLLGSTLSLSSYSFSVTMNTGDYRAIRLMYGNTVGVAELDFTITAPDGTKYASNTPQTSIGSLGPQVIQFPCNSAQGANFSAWGAET